MAFFLHEWERLSWNFCFACRILHRIDLFGPSAGKASHILGFRLPIVSNLWVNIVLGKSVLKLCWAGAGADRQWRKFVHGCMLTYVSHVWLCETLRTAACQAPPSWESPGNAWRGLPCPSPRIFPTQGLYPSLYVYLHWQMGFFTRATREAQRKSGSTSQC